MKIINLPRKAGKTHQLCELVKKQNGIMLVRNKDVVETMIKNHGLTHDQCMTWEEATDGSGGLFIGRDLKKRPIYGDDADWFLSTLIGWKLEGISVNKDI